MNSPTSSSDAASPQDWRARATADLTREPLDVLVVGGGIVGSGIARDAAMRGLRAGLVEQHDFAFGTSSRSSRLLHGGLRYLAQGRIGLVREASLEKRVLHHIAPHLAEPLAFIFPAYRGDPHWVLWQLKIGVKIYDLLCSGHNLGKSAWLSRQDVLDRVPGLTGEGLAGAVRYYDGFTNDARLTLDTLRSAAAAGAVLLSYCRFNGASRNDFWECELLDSPTGRKRALQARAVVNATGPWADGLPHSHVKLRATKGIHCVVPRERLPVPDSVVMTQAERILFAIPWGERTILGTTDTDYSGNAEDVRADAADLAYVLEITNRFFPKARLVNADLLSVWAGLRPLIAGPGGAPSDISRSHEIRSPEPGWWDVAGGKLTTYRLMAEQTIDRIVEWLDKPQKGRGGRRLTVARVIEAAQDKRRQGRGERRAGEPPGPCRTAQEPLLPPAEIGGLSGILPPEPSRRAVEHYVRNEWALHLDDVMLRRSSWHYYRADAPKLAEQTAGWMGEMLGWSAEERAAELERYTRATALPR